MNIVICSPTTHKTKVYTESQTHTFNNLNQSILDVLEADNDVLLVSGLSSMSKIQFSEWLNMSSWFDGFSEVSIDEALNMTVVFCDAKNNNLHICSPDKGTEKHPLQSNQPIDDKLPERIAFVESADLMTQKQFAKKIDGAWLPPKTKKSSLSPVSKSKKYIHTVHDGTVLIEDIQVKLSGKWRFTPVDDIGEDKLYNSLHFQVLLKKGKVEIVDQAYVDANKHKTKKSVPIDNTLPVGSVSDFLEEKDNSNDGVIKIDVQ